MRRFKQCDVIAVHYDENRPDVYEAGVFLGAVIKTSEDRLKVLYLYETGEDDIAWLRPNGQRGDWIDTTNSAIVRVDEADESQRQDFFSRIPAERVHRLLERGAKR